MRWNIIVIFITGLLKKIPAIYNWHTKQKVKLKNNYKISIAFDRLAIKRGLHIEIVGLNYVDEKKGWVIHVEKVVIKLLISRLFTPMQMVGSLSLHKGEIKRISVSGQKGPVNTATDYDRILKRMYAQGSRMMKKLFLALPKEVQIQQVALVMNEKNGSRLELVNICLNKGKLALEIAGYFKQFQYSLRSAGTLDHAADKAHILLNSSLVRHNTLQEEQEKQLTLNELQTELSVRWNKNEFRGSAGLHVPVPGILLGRPATSTDVSTVTMKLDFLLNAGGFFISEGSSVGFNNLLANVLYEHQFHDRCGKLNIHVTGCSMADVLNCFPRFYFKPFYKASFSGTLDFSYTLAVQLFPPYKFNVESESFNDLCLQDPEQIDLNYLKGPFVHSVYEDGAFLGDIYLDSSNPAFVPLACLPAFLVEAIILAEDRGFYKHRGIDLKILGFAFLHNVAAKRMVRGGSTITAQVVKNLFLNHQRLISRKVEEMILSWLIEQVFSVSKDRILEIYINIIEFAPKVYGITAASKLYFSKTPQDLSLTESIILTYIIPRPKFFLDAVQSNSPVLLKNLTSHIEMISLEMLKRAMISEEDYKSIESEIVFAGGSGQISLPNKMKYLCSDLCDCYVKALTLWVKRHKELPVPFLVCTYRSFEEQEALYNEGRVTGDKIVTFARPGESPHNIYPSLAFDIGFKDPFGSYDWSENLFVQFAALVKEVDEDNKIIWGGNFENFKDMPHFELSGWHGKKLQNIA